MTDPVVEALNLARAEFALRIRAITADQWSAPTPCDEWTVRELVNHVVGQEFRFADNIKTNDPAWYVATRDDDFLADDPIAAWNEGRRLLDDAIGRLGSFDEEIQWRVALPARSVLVVRIFEAAVHAWDLSRAIGYSDVIDSRLIELALPLAQRIASDPSLAGMLGEPRGVPSSEATPQEQLLHLAGR